MENGFRQFVTPLPGLFLCLLILIGVNVVAQEKEKPVEAKEAPLKKPEGMDEGLWEVLLKNNKKNQLIKTLKGEFVQEKYTPLLKKPFVSRGRILVKGSRVLWDTLEPQKTSMLITSKELKLYYPEDKLIEIYPVDKKLGQLATSPIPELRMLMKHFKLSRLGDDEIKDKDLKKSVVGGELIALRLKPKEKELGEHVKEVHVYVYRKEGYAKQMVMQLPDDERSVMTFSKVELNKPLKDEEVDLNPPADVEKSYPLKNAE